jgi:hypothetical protein
MAFSEQINLLNNEIITVIRILYSDPFYTKFPVENPFQINAEFTHNVLNVQIRVNYSDIEIAHLWELADPQLFLPIIVQRFATGLFRFLLACYDIGPMPPFLVRFSINAYNGKDWILTCMSSNLLNALTKHEIDDLAGIMDTLDFDTSESGHAQI